LRWLLRRFPALPVVLGFGMAAAFLLSFAALSLEMMEGETLPFDTWVRGALHGHASPPVTAFMIFVTTAGSVVGTTVAALLTCLGLWRAGHWRRAILLAVCVGGAILLMGILKVVFQRVRPEPFFDTPLPLGYSFPSGHTLVSSCFYSVAAAFATAHERRLLVRVLIWAAAASVILLIGVSRIYLGVHYPSDVVAGYLVAGVWVSAIAFAYRRWSSRLPPQ
jgi:undecaprenyl-diphosphatase